MKRPRTATPRRPATGSGRTARTSKDAAISLVRVEFDLSRLSMGIAQAEDRIRTYKAEQSDKLRQRDRLIALISR